MAFKLQKILHGIEEDGKAKNKNKKNDNKQCIKDIVPINTTC